MDDYLKLFNDTLKKNNSIIYFYKDSCFFCLQFEKIWYDFYQQISKNNIHNISLIKINVGDIHRDIDEIWKKQSLYKKDKSYLLNNEEKNTYKINRNYFINNNSSGIFNVDSEDENIIKRGTPTILFIRDNDFYFFPKNRDKNLIELIDVYSLIYNDILFSPFDIKCDITMKDVYSGKITKPFIYIVSPFVLSNDINVINSKNHKNNIIDIDTLYSTINKKFSVMSYDKKQLFHVLDVIKDYSRYDIPYPSIYDVKNDKLYIYKDCLEFLDYIASL